jgi:hypothetical protein
MDFATNHLHWNNDDWGQMSPDFCLDNNDGRVRVFIHRNERHAKCNIRQLIRFGAGSVMVCGGISLTATTGLHVINPRSLNSRSYIADILEPHRMCPICPYFGDDFILMQGNVKPRTARIVKECLRDVGIQFMNWPVRSPDLNPREQLWDNIGKRLQEQMPPPANLNEVRQRVVEIWEDIEQGQYEP